MGIFSFFKKNFSTSSFMCDFINGPEETYKSASLTFLGDGTFRINSDVFKANFPYVKDIGMSRDFKYDRISTGGFLFYANKNDGAKLLKSLNDERTVFVMQSIKSIPQKDFSKHYLAPGMGIGEVPLVFNVQGVSYNYQADTRKKISQMRIGSTLSLKYWPDAPDAEHKVCVFDEGLCQIGYFSLDGDDDDLIHAELKKQFEFGIPFTATVIEKGIVQDTDIWWCKADFTLKFPYPVDSEIVFVNGFGGEYHCRCGCCGADWKIPMSWANRYGMRPCKRCHKAQKEEASPLN